MNFLDMRIEADGMPAAAPGTAPYVRRASVGANYLDAFEAPMVAGRRFTESDLAPGRHVAIVDQTFARIVFNGQDAVGRHVREAAGDGQEAGPWIEIVGIVRDLTDDTNKKFDDSMLFKLAAADDVYPLYVAVHARSNPAAIMSRTRILAADVDPSLRLTEMMTMDKLGESDLVALDFFARLMAGISVVAIILATAGVYALMSFTVARRTQEIGIRVALGANPRRIVTSTFARGVMQVALGLLAAIGPEVAATNGSEVAVWTCLISVGLVAIVTAIACVFPARRALRIQPIDTLKTT
jgi:hypothetical protein